TLWISRDQRSWVHDSLEAVTQKEAALVREPQPFPAPIEDDGVLAANVGPWGGPVRAAKSVMH
ncbi:MAG TPA: hypothetical protein PK435_13805, partial [Thermoanaerobaculaceae bacterium]|nr:hypothetical protein [Thermoanaerobaculaceae bacterium]